MSPIFNPICLNPILFESNLIDYVQKPTIIFKETFFLGRILNLFAVIAIVAFAGVIDVAVAFVAVVATTVVVVIVVFAATVAGFVIVAVLFRLLLLLLIQLLLL